MSENAAGPSESGQIVTRKIRLHKVMRPLDETGADRTQVDFQQHMERRIAEILPSIADLPVPLQSSMPSALADARAVELRRLQDTKQELALSEAQELATLFDMSKPHPLDNAPPTTPWTGALRPVPRKIVLSPYQYEMINYQRMLMRKNIWYYRDRMNVPRGPCPLHVLKEAWVTGIVDENTLMWGHGLYDWLPAKNIKLLLPMIRTPEVRLAAWIKRTFSLKPSLNRIREQRKEHRDPEDYSLQVELMR
ncbi:hypothetical protein VOLCADRAFT_106447 [Volvox carteri f. nagariensis]|uniref:GYF domain-containing protein n=1 Tax=Volvox carteri f. nagariensis TaxID=3068 RepID=D8U7G0_VOLCA|nr:uncharacterized protein VOLCADRAFT_106447 [Volvox carteri f. nagariensis]EFJ44293.1 hypothetical protein VOLCADRAFT_106447 [Volvox carteri f. nagariensis]|eukprot:XP_002954652.1 hypothetical protein VOLCADRAFT_106447 [Volvox carteri f. nagariensis]